MDVLRLGKKERNPGFRDDEDVVAFGATGLETDSVLSLQTRRYGDPSVAERVARGCRREVIVIDGCGDNAGTTCSRVISPLLPGEARYQLAATGLELGADDGRRWPRRTVREWLRIRASPGSWRATLSSLWVGRSHRVEDGK
ncbi:hypothetical protein MRX96_008344 [Rhipicephalus microplus]